MEETTGFFLHLYVFHHSQSPVIPSPIQESFNLRRLQPFDAFGTNTNGK
jgi:hypothetical protein